jgi:2'-hydroxyisoflavone reductase
MHVLVMGGTRLMGLETVRRLLSGGHEVSVFNRGTRQIEWPGPVNELRGDRDVAGDLEAVRDLAPEAVVDFSSYTSSQTALLLDALPEVARLVYCSSGAVYAPDPVLPWSEERTPAGPWPLWSAYGLEMLMREPVRRRRRAAGALSTTILRPPMVLGPANYVPREEWVFNRLLDGEEVLIPGDGRAVSHFVSAGQVAAAAVASVDAFGDGVTRVFNVADPTAVSSALGFVQLCAEVAGTDVRVRRVDPTTGVFNALENVFPFPSENYLLDTRAAEAAGIQPEPVGLRSMLRSAYEDLLANPQRRRWSRSQSELEALGR